MDLGAYAKIEDLQHLMEENGIEILRLRGLRLMKNEKPLSQEEIDSIAKNIGLNCCEYACRGYFEWGDCGCLYSDGTNKMVKKYFIRSKDEEYGGYNIVDINWKNIHGKGRKRFKYELKLAKKRVEKQYAVWNKYAGQDGILYIRARLGGYNWTCSYYDCPNTIAKQPWFLEKVDDAFDNTYCDIYASSECTAPKIETPSEEPVILTAARIRELRWYTVPQLAAIYNYGKVKVRIQDSDAAYRELRWLNAQQLAAIFGTGDDTDGD